MLCTLGPCKVFYLWWSELYFNTSAYFSILAICRLFWTLAKLFHLLQSELYFVDIFILINVETILEKERGGNKNAIEICWISPCNHSVHELVSHEWLVMIADSNPHVIFRLIHIHSATVVSFVNVVVITLFLVKPYPKS